jgi:hypothetical protein
MKKKKLLQWSRIDLVSVCTTFVDGNSVITYELFHFFISEGKRTLLHKTGDNARDEWKQIIDAYLFVSTLYFNLKVGGVHPVVL